MRRELLFVEVGPKVESSEKQGAPDSPSGEELRHHGNSSLTRVAVILPRLSESGGKNSPQFGIPHIFPSRTLSHLTYTWSGF